MKLLVLPDLSWTDDTAWMRAIDFKLQDVPELDISKFIKKSYERPAEKPNMQTPEVFESERFRIDKAFPVIRWVRPSDGDRDLVQFQTAPAVAWEQGPCRRAQLKRAAICRAAHEHDHCCNFIPQ